MMHHKSMSLFGPTTTNSGYFGLLPLCLNPKIRRFDPKLLDFSQLKPRKITKNYLSQIIKSKLKKLESRKEKKVKVKNPSSRTQQGSFSSRLEI